MTAAVQCLVMVPQNTKPKVSFLRGDLFGIVLLSDGLGIRSCYNW